jgi:hypothetical protein
MTEAQAEVALALVTGVRAGATPVDVYGTAWGGGRTAAGRLVAEKSSGTTRD